jgi:hypothetical protein
VTSRFSKDTATTSLDNNPPHSLVVVVVGVMEVRDDPS